jgi:AraC family transcriptional regulator
LNNYERIQKSIDFMEENLREPITLEDVARVTCFSLPHFYRLFNALVGRTIKDYLRLRRLSEAARDVASTGRSILDIALDYQFSSQESFSKAFRQAWGVSPDT